MVGPLMLLKMLHCKRLRKNKSKPSNKHEIKLENVQDITIKTESNETQNLCRVCLKDGSVHIFNSNADDLADAFYLFAGIEIQVDDPYPKSLCQSCHALLQGAILFRTTAQQSDKLLRQPPINSSFPVDSNIEYNETLDINENDEVIHNTKEKDKYNCRKCNIEFNDIKEYREHKLSEEHDNRRLECPVCHNLYHEGYIKKHIALHKLETHYMCDICGKKFTIQGHFTRHRVTHFYKLPYKCSLCPYRGRFTESLKMHMRSHTGEKPYQCAECSARFINKSNLNKHMLTHKADHDFKCENCGRGFYSQRELDLHFKVDHTGIKDHICNICGKAFGYRKQMMKHQLKVHKRQKLRSGRMPLYLQVETMKQQGEIVDES